MEDVTNTVLLYDVRRWSHAKVFCQCLVDGTHTESLILLRAQFCIHEGEGNKTIAQQQSLRTSEVTVKGDVCCS